MINSGTASQRFQSQVSFINSKASVPDTWYASKYFLPSIFCEYDIPYDTYMQNVEFKFVMRFTKGIPGRILSSIELYQSRVPDSELEKDFFSRAEISIVYYFTMHCIPYPDNYKPLSVIVKEYIIPTRWALLRKCYSSLSKTWRDTIDFPFEPRFDKFRRLRKGMAALYIECFIRSRVMWSGATATLILIAYFNKSACTIQIWNKF